MDQKKVIKSIYTEIKESIEELNNLKNNIFTIATDSGDPTLDYFAILKINRDKTLNQIRKLRNKINEILYENGKIQSNNDWIITKTDLTNRIEYFNNQRGYEARLSLTVLNDFVELWTKVNKSSKLQENSQNETQ